MEPAPAGATEDEVASFIRELNQAFPALDLTRSDVTLVHRGLVPAVRTPAAAPGSMATNACAIMRLDGVDGLISVAGTKYTTVRAVAQRVVDRGMAKLQRPRVPCRTATHPLPGGSVRDLALTIGEARRDHDVGLPSDTIPHLVDRLRIALSRRASTSRRIGRRGARAWRTPHRSSALSWSGPRARKWWSRSPTRSSGERRSARSDIPGDPAVERAAQIVGGELGWTEERRREEMAAVKRFYEIK